MKEEEKKKKTSRKSNTKTNQTKKGTTAKKKTEKKIEAKKKEIKKQPIEKTEEIREIKVGIKEETKRTPKKKKDKIMILLWIIFVLLFLLVIGLFGRIQYLKNEEKSHPNANISIPIIKEGDTIEFHITTLGLSKEEGYVFKLTNYSGEDINKEEMTYDILMSNSSDSKIEIQKLNSKDKWILKENLEIVNETLQKEEKEEVYYRVKVLSSNELEKTDLITIQIKS